MFLFLHLILRCGLIDNQMQKTLDSEVFTSGVGLFSGEKVSIRLKPAPAESGIVFQRIDLPNRPLIKKPMRGKSGISQT